jgi:FkbM family methyltransferase
MKLTWTSFKNRLKSIVSDVIRKIKITHKLDYKNADILMCDNIRLNSCAKEPGTIRWIETFGKDDVFMDIGANAGAYSLVASKHCRLVYAFEPSVFNFYILEKNILANKITNIIPFNIALYRDKRISAFSYNQTSEGGSCNTIVDKSDGNNWVQQVLSYPLDDFVKEFNLPQIDHIKLDVDGNEREILEGAANLLKRVKSIPVEADNDPHNKIIGFLTDMGFKKTEQHRLDDKYSNYIFTR